MSRLDLSDLCFVDDLVSLLIFWWKSQLSRFAEMVSQVLETGRLRVLEVLVELQDQVRAASIQELLAEHTSSHFEVKQFEPPQKLDTLGARWSLRETRAEAQMRVTNAINAQARESGGLWAPRSIGLATRIRLW